MLSMFDLLILLIKRETSDLPQKTKLLIFEINNYGIICGCKKRKHEKQFYVSSHK